MNYRSKNSGKKSFWCPNTTLKILLCACEGIMISWKSQLFLLGEIDYTREDWLNELHCHNFCTWIFYNFRTIVLDWKYYKSRMTPSVVPQLIFILIFIIIFLVIFHIVKTKWNKIYWQSQQTTFLLKIQLPTPQMLQGIWLLLRIRLLLT